MGEGNTIYRNQKGHPRNKNHHTPHPRDPPSNSQIDRQINTLSLFRVPHRIGLHLVKVIN